MSAKNRALNPQDVMLISPTIIYPPLSASLTAPNLAAPLLVEGYSVGFQDYSLPYMESEALEAAANSKVAGFSVNTTLMPYAMAIADILKKINPDVKIVFGGYHPTDAPKECFQSPSVDFVLRGEADLTFVDLVKLIDGEPKNIPGLVYKQERSIPNVPLGGFIDDLNSLPIPDFSIVDWGAYRESEKFGVDLGRGCVGKCGFCSPSHFWNHNLRLKSVERVIAEYEELYKLTGTKHTRTEGDIFMPIDGWYDKIAQYLGQQGYSWSIQTRADLFDEFQFQTLIDNGLSSVFSGIEFGSAQMRKKIGKDFDKDRFKRIVEISAENDIDYTISLLIGYLGETESTVAETYEFAKWALGIGVSRVKVFIPAAFPGTNFTQTIVKKRLLVNERVFGYESVDPSTALHRTGTGPEHLSPQQIENVYTKIKNKLDGVVAGSNSKKGHEDARKRGERRFDMIEHDWGNYKLLLEERLEHYKTIFPPYLMGLS